MKKIVSLLFAALFTLALLVGCGNTQQTTDSGKIKVMTTIFPPYDFTRQIAGDKVELTMLVPPGSETHSYEPTPQDMVKIGQSDIFIYNGGENDKWVDKVLESAENKNLVIIKMMDCVKTVKEEVKEGMEEEKEEHDHEGEEGVELDEHVWTSPQNAKKIAQKISDTLVSVDSKNAETYKANTANYLKQLDDLDNDFANVVKDAKRKTLIFGDRFPFRYLTDAYGLNYYAAFPGCSTESEASVATVTFLVDKVKAEKIPVVFYIEFSNEKMADTICESTGAKKLLLHSCHNVSPEDIKDGKNYIDLMKQNVANLKEALQ